jgi:hypothetical protein
VQVILRDSLKLEVKVIVRVQVVTRGAGYLIKRKVITGGADYCFIVKVLVVTGGVGYYKSTGCDRGCKLSQGIGFNWG